MRFGINATGWLTDELQFFKRQHQVRQIEIEGATFDQNAGKITAGMGGVGAQGPQGVEGPVGPQGEQGPMGTSFVWRGTWSGATAYVTNDAVERSGETYIALQNGTNQDPAVGQPDNLFWDILAVAGVQGPTGADGPQGTTGPTGAQGIQGIQGIQGVPGGGVDYIQDTDPGAVGAGKTWFKESVPAVYLRNSGNTAWDRIL